MKLFIPKETAPGETRAAMVPASVGKLTDLGLTVQIEAGISEHLSVGDDAYIDAGASRVEDRRTAMGEADIVLRVKPPTLDEVGQLKQGCLHISYLDPFNQKELLGALKKQQVSAVSMEMIPRTTLAQKMDALSSQASLAGYVSVILAAERLNRVFPMMMTPAGTITPANVFVLGAGVAGLQAIATAKRLGARVTAFDIRPASATEVESLGAKFLKIDLGETGQTEQGYAKELTPEQMEKQREGQAKQCAQSDIVITTAQLFGRKAPVLITRDVVERMKPGSIIVDMAVESGGNVEGSTLNEEVEVNGVRILGHGNLPGRVPDHASQVYASNLVNLVAHCWDNEAKQPKLDREDPIIAGCLITHAGELVNERLKQSS